jgi:hypothetical protein
MSYRLSGKRGRKNVGERAGAAYEVRGKRATDSAESESDHRSLDELGNELWLQNVVSPILGTLKTGETRVV